MSDHHHDGRKNILVSFPHTYFSNRFPFEMALVCGRELNRGGAKLLRMASQGKSVDPLVALIVTSRQFPSKKTHPS